MSLKANLLLTSFCAAAATLALTAPAARAETTLPAHLQSVDRGPTDAQKIITVTVHLHKSDEAGFHKTVADLYDRSSPRFHKWLSDAELKTFAPSQAARDAVTRALTEGHLTVLGTDKNGFMVRARGTVADVNRVFHTEIHDFLRNGEVFRRNTVEPRLDGPANDYVKLVAGLESHIVHPMLSQAKNLSTGKAYTPVPLKTVRASGGLGGYVTNDILLPSGSYTFSSSDSTPQTVTYTGVGYNGAATQLPDYTPKNLEKAYGLPDVYKKGLTGAGQNVVLLEAYGYPTMEADAAAAAKLEGLPPLTSSNFNVVYPEGLPADPNAGILVGWNIEIALDIQSSRSIAPGANTVVVAATGQDDDDFQYCMQYIIDNNIGSTVSDSWEEDTDLIAGAAEQQAFDEILEIGAAKGVSFQFSTGDGGDGGLGTPIGAPGLPSVAPHATAVGGTSIFNNVGGSGTYTTGWGDTFAYLAFEGPIYPPEAFFVGGGGGGQSVYWPRPIWQSNLSGLGRQVPDVSALADPYTGFPLVITLGTEQVIYPGWGGTSLASPIFTAFWAIAQQSVGGPLGQASPLLASLKTGLVDVLPGTNPNNLTGVYNGGSGNVNISSLGIFGSTAYTNTGVLATIVNYDSGVEALSFGFGLDSSLTVTPGWDNATGYGTPYGLPFIKAVTAAATAP